MICTDNDFSVLVETIIKGILIGDYGKLHYLLEKDSKYCTETFKLDPVFTPIAHPILINILKVKYPTVDFTINSQPFITGNHFISLISELLLNNEIIINFLLTFSLFKRIS